MPTVSVRYIVHDVDQAIAFYVDRLGFTEVMHPAPAFAMLAHGDLRLVLSAPGDGPGGGQAMADGTAPRPGGWNRFALEVDDSSPWSTSYARTECVSATTSSTASEASRRSLRIPPATRSSFSSQPSTRPGSESRNKPGWR